MRAYPILVFLQIVTLTTVAMQAYADDNDRTLMEKYDREYEVSKVEIERKEAAQRKLCGNEFHKPRVGMTLARINECIGKAVMMGQVNRADGVVSTYQAGYYYLHVSNDKVIAWTRR